MIEEKLQETRRRLLDLTRANRLLNHRPGERSRRSLAIVDEPPEEVYRLLVEEEKSLQFLSREEAPQQVARDLPEQESDLALPEAPSAADTWGLMEAELPLAPIEPPGGGESGVRGEEGVRGQGSGSTTGNSALTPDPSPRHIDRNLQTLLSGPMLQSRLLHLAREARSALEEQGSNILYLVLGVVQWCTEQEPDILCRAPLVFVPVELSRKSVMGRHAVRVFEDDILTNPCLAELCKRQFELDLPLFDAEAEGADLGAYLKAVGTAIEPLSRWQVLPEVHLGLFSFSKLLMYRDLDDRNWPEGHRLAAHPLIRRLAGEEVASPAPASAPASASAPAPAPAAPAAPDPRKLDDEVKPNDCFQVVDADSSQQAAILAAKRGMSLVIEGPPGTGKSQTITNIIAECLAEGKTVLFVAEKSAALDVVRRRLANVGLGDFVLELHSRKASKRLVLQELQRVLDSEQAAAPAVRARQVEADELLSARSRLNAYVRQLHEPLGKLGISPYQAISRAIALSDATEATAAIAQPLEWTGPQLTEAVEKVQVLERRLERVGAVEEHPWRGVGLTATSLEVRQNVLARCEELAKALGAVAQEGTGRAENSQRLSELLGMTVPATVAVAERMLDAARVLLSVPVLPAATVADARWDTMPAAVQRMLMAGEERQKRKAIWGRLVGPEQELVDWNDVLMRRLEQRSSLLRLVSFSWYADGRRLKAAMRGRVPPVSPPAEPGQRDGPQCGPYGSPVTPESQARTPVLRMPPIEQQIELLAALVESAALRRQIEAEAATVQATELFGGCYSGPDSDWTALRRFAESAVAVRQLVRQGVVGLEAAQRLVGGADAQGELRRSADVMQQALTTSQGAWEGWARAIAADDGAWLKSPRGPRGWKQTEIVTILGRLEPLPAAIDSLDDWVDLRCSTTEAVGTPLEPFVTWAVQSWQRESDLSRIFQRHFYRLWMDAAVEHRPALKRFRGGEHQLLIGRFADLDVRWLEASRHRLVAMVAEDRPDMDHAANRQSKLGIVQAEIRKKARHMPLRRLFALAGEVVQAIKPCFMMSPLSVAQYLQPGHIAFDVVIFDEASQVEPADAYGAVARGRQLLLVGDEKQLPPTAFFSKIDSAEGEAEADGADLRIADLESVLSLGLVRLPDRCSLRWHYRSRHASLIDFSNRRFYDGHLRVFPSPHTDCSEAGLSLQFVADAVYQRGAGRYNPVEAEAVAREVIRHVREHPELSLGVGALNLPQQEAIEDAVERLRRQEPEEAVESFFAAHEEEPFFVKNLENIQGDERDVIFLSVGFGRDAAGKITANFGALNSEGGWRRLNVFITRARRRCVVFSSIKAQDVPVTAGSPRGVAALRDYLYVAEHGRLEEDAPPAQDHEGTFEQSVAAALRENGWQVHAQVGSAGSRGFWIDLAVVNPDEPGRYLMGIECDGPVYANSPTARDRDRLRRMVLTNLGWNIVRLWCPDWLKDRQQVLRELLATLEEARRGCQLPARSCQLPVASCQSPSVDPQAPPKDEANEAEQSGVAPYPRRRMRKRAASTLQRMGEGELAGVVVEIVRNEGPIHREEAVRVVAESFSSRVSPRVQAAVEAAVKLAATQRRIEVREPFLWAPGATAVVRRREDDCPVKEAELICPEEYAAAIRLVIQKEFGLKEDSLVESAARVMGFRRTGPAFAAQIREVLGRMVATGEVRTDAAGFLVYTAEGAG